MVTGNSNNNNTIVKSKSAPNMKKFQIVDDVETAQKKQGRAARFQKDFKKSSSFNAFNNIPKGDLVSDLYYSRYVKSLANRIIKLEVKWFVSK